MVRDGGKARKEEVEGMGEYGDDEPLFKRFVSAYDTCTMQRAICGKQTLEHVFDTQGGPSRM